MKAFYYAKQTFKSLLITLGIVLIGTIGSAAAVEMTSSATLSGSILTSRIDTNNDNSLAVHSTYVTDDTVLGRAFGQNVIERQTAASPTGFCPAGQLESELVTGSAVETYPDGAQLFLQRTESPLCVDLATGMFSGTFRATILGGTGRLEGVTGSREGSFTGFVLLVDTDPEANQIFGPFTGDLTQVLDIPDGSGPTAQDCNGDGVANGLDLIGAGCE